MQLDQSGSFIPSRRSVWVHGLAPKRFFTPFRSKYRKMIHGGVIAKDSSLLIKKTDFHFSPYLLSYPRVKMVNLTCKPYGLVGFNAQTPNCCQSLLDRADTKAATFLPASPCNAGSNYPHGLLRVAPPYA